MSRHRKTLRAAGAAPSAPPPAVALPVLLERTLVGALAALVVARPLVAGDDPGRLRLTSGGGPLSFDLSVFILMLGAMLWRAAYGRGRLDWRALVFPLLLVAVGEAGYQSSGVERDGRYVHPGVFIAWEWVAVGSAVYLTRRVVPAAADSRGLVNVLLASAVSISGLAVYQLLSDRLGLPSTDVIVPPESVPLAGDDEFYPELNRPPVTAPTPSGTFDSAATFLVFLAMVLPAALVIGRCRERTATGRWAMAIPVILVAGAVVAILARPFDTSPGHWSAAVRLIREHPLLGVGPGNFSRFAPDVLTPDSAWLGLAATTGLIGLGLFIAAVVMAVRAAWPAGVLDAVEPPVRGTRWEFYIGGMVGLLLGFVWSTGEMPAEAPPAEVFKLGGAAIFRAILWFSSFAILEAVRPAPGALRRALLAGVGIVIAIGFLSDAPGLPTILFPIGVVLALAMNLNRPAAAAMTDGNWTRPVHFIGAIVAAGLAIAYLVSAALPGWGTTSAVRQARMASRHLPERHEQYVSARAGPEKANALTAARGYLLANIVNPLRDAADRDPGNAALWLEVARWRRPLWEYQLIADPQEAALGANRTRDAAERAGLLDPRNLASKRNLFETFLLFRSKSPALQPERLAVLDKLAGQIAEREPQAEVPLRYRIVRMLLDRGEPDGLEAEVSELLRLNRVEGAPHGQISDDQRAEVIGRAKMVLKDLPAERLEEWDK